MLKITVCYSDEAELLRVLPALQPYITRCKPPLDQPGKKGPESAFYKRYMRLDTNPSDSVENSCTAQDGVL